MKKLILFIGLLIIIVMIGQSIALVGGELSWIIHYENTTTQEELNIREIVTYEYTCQTEYFEIDTEIKYAECFERTNYNDTNQSWNYDLLFGHSYDWGSIANKTMYWNVNEVTGTYIDYVNTTVQERIGAMKDSRYLIFEDCEIMCGKVDDIVSCDSTRDGNGDGILQDGESGFSFDIDKLTWYNIMIKSDSIWFSKLKECIFKNE